MGEGRARPAHHALRGALLEADLERPHLEHVAVVEQHLFDAQAVDENAVAAAEVHRPHLAAAHLHLGVAPGDDRVVQDDVVLQGAADVQPPLGEAEGLLLAADVHRQAGHGAAPSAAGSPRTNWMG